MLNRAAILPSLLPFDMKTVRLRIIVLSVYIKYACECLSKSNTKVMPTS